MDSKTSKQASSSSSKRLLFDRRYGWVVDEWKDPSEEALSGGRGMFCILPLAKALIKNASQSVNLAASSAVKFIERPDLLSPQLLQASLNDQVYKIKSVIKKPELNLLAFKGSLPIDASSCSSQTDGST